METFGTVLGLALVVAVIAFAIYFVRKKKARSNDRPAGGGGGGGGSRPGTPPKK